jgi:hypothetical protein
LDFLYSVFDLVVRSNVALPGVPLRTAIKIENVPAAVQFHLGVEPYPDGFQSVTENELVYVSSYLNERGEAVLQIWKDADENFLRLDYCDGTRFWFDGSRQNVWACWPADSTLENTLSYLLGPVFGLLLRLRGVTCLHASAVAIDDWGIVFVGSEGAGKSTTAAAFARCGYAVLSDDIVALKSESGRPPDATASVLPHVTMAQNANEFAIVPAYPHLCLWRDSAQALYDETELPRLAPEWDKRKLSLGTAGARFETRALPLGAIYLFTDRGPEPAPYVKAAQGQTPLVSLLANTYANNLLDRRMRAEEFAVLDRLVANVPIRLLTPHHDVRRLEQLVACIRDDFRQLIGANREPLAPAKHQT